MMLADLQELSITTSTGRVIKLTPEEEEAAYKRALQRSVEECCVNAMTREVQLKGALYHALGLAAGITLGAALVALIVGRKS